MYEYVKKNLNQNPIIIDADDLEKDPGIAHLFINMQKVMNVYCEGPRGLYQHAIYQSILAL